MGKGEYMSFSKRFKKLIFGLFLYAFGIILSINANIGYSPWEVFHVGLTKVSSLSLGIVSIITGVVIVLATMILGEKFGIATILNMFLIGIFIDIIIYLNIIPIADNLVFGIVMFMVGLVVIAFATYFYISSGFGAGPRDGLMVVLSRKTGFPVGVCRGIIEFLVTVSGYFLGGMVGIGTIICVAFMGMLMQGIFKLMNFEPKDIKHESVRETLDRFIKK